MIATRKSLVFEAKKPNNSQGNEIKVKSEFVKARHKAMQLWSKIF